jgi:hypothetical protein
MGRMLHQYRHQYYLNLHLTLHSHIHHHICLVYLYVLLFVFNIWVNLVWVGYLIFFFGKCKEVIISLNKVCLFIVFWLHVYI